MKIDRLIGIISILLQKGKVTAPYLAEKFEVSRRTINRDIESISQSGIPLVTEQGQNGGISIMNGFSIDRTALSSSDMNAILTGLQSLDSISGTKQYQQLMEKLCAGTSDAIPKTDKPDVINGTGIYINLSSYHKSSLAPKIELFKKAIQNHNEVSFTYYSPRGKTKRIVDPYILIFWWSSWYVWSYCNLRKEFRLFKLNRMANLKTEDKIFTPEKQIPSPEYVMQKIYPQEIKVKLSFSPEVKWRIIDEFGAEYVSCSDEEKIIVETSVTDKENLFVMLLTYGTQVELLEPKEFRKEFVDYIAGISKKYAK